MVWQNYKDYVFKESYHSNIYFLFLFHYRLMLHIYSSELYIYDVDKDPVKFLNLEQH